MTAANWQKLLLFARGENCGGVEYEAARNWASREKTLKQPEASKDLWQSEFNMLETELIETFHISICMQANKLSVKRKSNSYWQFEYFMQVIAFYWLGYVCKWRITVYNIIQTWILFTWLMTTYSHDYDSHKSDVLVWNSLYILSCFLRFDTALKSSEQM